jgi:hypothetical protein
MSFLQVRRNYGTRKKKLLLNISVYIIFSHRYAFNYHNEIKLFPPSMKAKTLSSWKSFAAHLVFPDKSIIYLICETTTEIAISMISFNSMLLLQENFSLEKNPWKTYYLITLKKSTRKFCLVTFFSSFERHSRRQEISMAQLKTWKNSQRNKRRKKETFC